MTESLDTKPPKSPFEELINRNISLLVTKGYGDKDLKAFRGTDDFRRKLEENISTCLMLGVVEDVTREFSVQRTGFFRNDKDIVFFSFGYAFNMEKNTLTLKGISASLGNSRIRLPFSYPARDLPHSSDMHKMLLTDVLNKQMGVDVLTQLARMEATDPAIREKINQQCFEHRGTFAAKGYLSQQKENREDRAHFTKAMRDKIFSALIDYPDKKSFLVVRTAQYLDDKSYKTVFRFGFKFDPAEVRATLTSLHAQQGQDKVVIFLDHYSQLPPATKVSEKLSTDQMIKQAQQLFDHSKIPKSLQLQKVRHKPKQR